MAEAEQVVEQTPAPQGLMASVEVGDDENSDNINENNIDHKAEVPEAKEEAIATKPEYIPEKFWDEKTGKVREENAFKSLSELEKAFSKGKHKAPEEYDTEILTSKGYDLDDPMVGTYVQWAKDNGVNQKGFEDLAKQIIEISGNTKETVEYEEKAELAKLGNNAQAIIKSNKQWADSLKNKGQFTDDERSEIDVLGYTASGQRTIQKLRAMMGDNRQIPTFETAPTGESDTEFNARMSSKMSDAKYGSDAKFTLDVEQEFEKRFKTD
tara:strand:+ start:790 stop:1593 length:804 start_codon:yes stop_codon:yes gene_type:complete